MNGTSCANLKSVGWWKAFGTNNRDTRLIQRPTPLFYILLSMLISPSEAYLPMDLLLYYGRFTALVAALPPTADLVLAKLYSY